MAEHQNLPLKLWKFLYFLLHMNDHLTLVEPTSYVHFWLEKWVAKRGGARGRLILFFFYEFRQGL
jgi:hypothetical protein